MVERREWKDQWSLLLFWRGNDAPWWRGGSGKINGPCSSSGGAMMHHGGEEPVERSMVIAPLLEGPRRGASGKINGPLIGPFKALNFPARSSKNQAQKGSCAAYSRPFCIPEQGPISAPDAPCTSSGGTKWPMQCVMVLAPPLEGPKGQCNVHCSLLLLWRDQKGNAMSWIGPFKALNFPAPLP